MLMVKGRSRDGKDLIGSYLPIDGGMDLGIK